MSEEIIVSVVMPTYNEEKYIENCILTLLQQDYPKEQMEWLFVDGESKDKTVEILQRYQAQYPTLITVLNNPQRLAPHALNIGIRASKGRYIVRLDAHADYATDYISKCVYWLEHTDADNVGGVAETKGNGFVGEANAEILSSKFGVGGSKFRTENESGYVDTVPFGAFRREIFDKVGYFNPEFPRSEDNDLNGRIRKSGGKIYLSNDIRFTYYCRDTLGGLLQQGLLNGNALFLTIRKNPAAMSVRHYVPFCFVLSLLLLPILSAFFPPVWWVLCGELAAYFALDVYFCLRGGKLKYFFYKLFVFPLFHIVYGIGSCIGMFGIKLY